MAKRKWFGLSAEYFWRECTLSVLFIQIAFFVSIVVFSVLYDLLELPGETVMTICLDLLMLAVDILMYWSCARNSAIERSTSLFLALVATNAVTNYLNALLTLLGGDPGHRTFLYALHLTDHVVSILMSVVFWYFIVALTGSKGKYDEPAFSKAILVLSTVGELLVFGNLFGEYFFTVDENGVYIVTDTPSAVSLVIPTVTLLVSVLFILRLEAAITQKIVLITYPLLPYVGILLINGELGTVLRTVLTFLSLFCIYSSLFVLREKQLAKRQQELAETKVNALVAQINPHFIYNTLGSISGLCIDDPEKAREGLLTFSDYLRNNFGKVAEKAVIPFSEEMKHLDSYIRIEQMRFPDITIRLDLQTTDFDIPPMTVQPLLENAITHGIMGREEGGTIVISSYEDEECYYVRIEDDGVGFKTLEKNDGREHVGVKNVAGRLQLLCGGDLIVIGKEGVGAVSLVKIPKKR